MASLLRQIVAGPRARHPEAGLDLCYVTDFIIATSGPSQTYPQLAYRNPLDQLVAFLDSKHGDNWAIWEFRAEGTGYPDEAVYGRVRHYPWPDHHPPPFRLVPMIMASMRNWLHGGDFQDAQTPNHHHSSQENPITTHEADPQAARTVQKPTTRNDKRVVVVHCKAGKGRSGSMATSYLVSEEGWSVQDALERFTARRMRPKFGAGVSIPSQLRWVSYVDRWTQYGKKYLDRPIEIVELHVLGLRNGVKVDVEGFIEDGKKIRVFHTFSKKERVVVEPGAPSETGIGEMIWDLAGYSATGGGNKVPEGVEFADAANPKDDSASSTGAGASARASVSADTSDLEGNAKSPVGKKRHTLIRKGTGLIQKVSSNVGDGIDKAKSKTSSNATTDTTDDIPQGLKPSEDPEPGGLAVIFKPVEPIRIPNSDVNISVERRNSTHKSLSLTMVSAVAHVWFNAFFEGQGPEQDGRPNDSGIFSIDWEAMDGIKGSSRKGSRALDRMSVVWRAVDDGGENKGEEIIEPPEGEPVPQLAPADWKGGVGNGEKDLGLRVQTEGSKDVSRASSLKSVERGEGDKTRDAGNGDDAKALEGLRASGPSGEDLVGKDVKT
ncbi:Telomerase protein component 1 [Conoideocrella luteorostrata]|uniref:phosphatidylinositol-3,4,5-trisphosphate 3-phosphatase n=1 Tax=Conoideocrella luteorostrata TaxID=1105319 RepID=A0AAJ0CGN3_9HYPO|nr:Telomerase protein component 1 [Conoideocrella luteorostrata]